MFSPSRDEWSKAAIRASQEIARLRALNAELVKALEDMVRYFGHRDTAIDAANEINARARAAIAKAKEERK